MSTAICLTCYQQTEIDDELPITGRLHVIQTVLSGTLFLTVINLYPFLFFVVVFFYISDVSFVCLYVLHMQLSCGIKSILTYLLTYL